MNKSYLIQFDRVKRLFIRFKEINDGKLFDGTYQNYEDDMHSFFVGCYHLKDWILKDKAYTSKNKVEEFITQKHSLSICADICNAYKHSELHKYRSSQFPRLDRIEAKLTVPKVGVFSLRHVVFNDVESYRFNIELVSYFKKLLSQISTYESGSGIISVNYIISTASGEIDAFSLAKECIDAWEGFCNGQNSSDT